MLKTLTSLILPLLLSLLPVPVYATCDQCSGACACGADSRTPLLSGRDAPTVGSSRSNTSFIVSTQSENSHGDMPTEACIPAIIVDRCTSIESSEETAQAEPGLWFEDFLQYFNSGNTEAIDLSNYASSLGYQLFEPPLSHGNTLEWSHVELWLHAGATLLILRDRRWNIIVPTFDETILHINLYQSKPGNNAPTHCGSHPREKIKEFLNGVTCCYHATQLKQDPQQQTPQLTRRRSF